MKHTEIEGIKVRLTECLAAHAIPGTGGFSSGTALENSPLDSLALMELSMLLEVEFGVELTPHDLERIESLQQLSELVCAST